MFWQKPQVLIALVASLALLGCASQRALREGEAMIARGEVDAGLRHLQEQSQQDPGNVALKAAARRQLDLRLAELYRDAEAARQRGDYVGATAGFQAMLLWEANNQRALAGLKLLENARRIDAMLAYAYQQKVSKPEEALGIVRQVLAEQPRQAQALRLRDELENRKAREASLRPRLAKALKAPISLQFRDQPIASVFDLISRIGKINFVLDRDVPQGLRTTLYVQDGTVEDVLNLILTTNQLERKVLSENSLLIYPKRVEKDRDYQDLVMRVFYLANADPKQVLAMLKQMVKTRDAYIDERLSLLIMRDTPEVIEVAERLVSAQDLPQSEVVLALEVLEVNRNDLLDLGIRYPDSVGVSVTGSLPYSRPGTGDGTPGVIKLSELENLNKNNVQFGFGSPTAVLNLLHRKGNTQVLANPQIRVRNREKAKIHIGDRVPIVTTVNANGVVSESISLLDVGLSLNVEPNVNPDEEVAVKLSLEVSNIVDQIQTKTGLVAYKVGSRHAETTLTLRDGETQMLAGLISQTEQDQRNALPGLGELPILDRLFGSRRNSAERTEVILLVTPRIVRNLPVPAPYITQFDSGSESRMGSEPLRLRPGIQIAPQLPGAEAAPQPSSTAPADTPIGAGRRG